MTGLSLALSEITLVVFTTLAPSGAVALAVLCALIAAGRDGAAGNRARFAKVLWVPIVVTMVGLVASATHLGNPSNALYVLTGIGRSPLSTEVGAAVTLLAVSGSFWLYGFSEHPRRGLQRAWAGAIVVLAAVFVTTIALAYATHTIPSWDTPFVPATLWCGALTGGPILALAVLRLAEASCDEPSAPDLTTARGNTPNLGQRPMKTAPNDTRPAGQAASAPRARRGHLPTALLTLASVAALAGLALGIAQGLALPGLRSSLTSAGKLVPHYWWMLAAAAILQLAGLFLAWRTVRPPRTAGPRRAPHPAVPLFGATALILAGLFITRFAFYMMHLTSGL